MSIRRGILCVTVAALTGGCVVGDFAARVVGVGSKIEAVYELEDRPTVILVDDPQNVLPAADLADYLAGRIGDDFMENEVVTQIIPTTMVSRLRAEESDFSQWPIDKVGRQVGAAQVIYVVMQHFQLSESGAIYRPAATVNVKVVDVAGGHRLFPVNIGQGHPVTTQRDYGSLKQDSATRTVISRQLMDALAVDVAHLFYKHAKPEPGERLPG